MKYAVGMGSGVMIYIPSFVKIGSGIQKFMGGDANTDTNSKVISLVLFFLFFQNKERG
jgi:hypothetical protein